MSQQYTLRAMAKNYTGGHSWDHLDGEACTKAADEIAMLRRENGVLRDLLLSPDPDIEPDNLRLHREKCDALDKVFTLKTALKLIEYVSRKDSLCADERLASVRTVVCAAISKFDTAPGSNGQGGTA